METMDVIASRRNIRRFRDAPVQREPVEKVLAASVLAPSAKNRRPWRFVVLQGTAREKPAARPRTAWGGITGWREE